MRCVTFGTLIIWTGEEGIVQSRGFGEWHYVTRDCISPWHMHAIETGAELVYTSDNDRVLRAEHIDGDWEWIKFLKKAA